MESSFSYSAEQFVRLLNVIVADEIHVHPLQSRKLWHYGHGTDCLDGLPENSCDTLVLRRVP